MRTYVDRSPSIARSIAGVTDEIDRITLPSAGDAADLSSARASFRPRINAIDDLRSGFILPGMAAIARKFIPACHTFREKGTLSLDASRGTSEFGVACKSEELPFSGAEQLRQSNPSTTGTGEIIHEQNIALSVLRISRFAHSDPVDCGIITNTVVLGIVHRVTKRSGHANTGRLPRAIDARNNMDISKHHTNTITPPLPELSTIRLRRLRNCIGNNRQSHYQLERRYKHQLQRNIQQSNNPKHIVHINTRTTNYFHRDDQGL
jgi:hypothetical protein